MFNGDQERISELETILLSLSILPPPPIAIDLDCLLWVRGLSSYMILHLAITAVRSTFNKSLIVSTDCLQSHLLVGSLRHQGPPCAPTYHYQAVYLLP